VKEEPCGNTNRGASCAERQGSKDRESGAR
jgi:hypothetical protein